MVYELYLNSAVKKEIQFIPLTRSFSLLLVVDSTHASFLV